MRKTLLSAAALLVLTVPALADETIVEWTLKGTQFDPSPLTVEAKGPFTIQFKNTNDVAAELECKDLKVEKPVVAGGTIKVKVLNPKPGTYDCVDEPHEDVAKAQIIIK